MKPVNPTKWFWLCWIFFSMYLGIFDVMHLPPQGMHQGAQSDRACVAWNYYHESMNFFLPRVSEDRGSEGVAGMEFPALPYTVALIYKITGSHDFIFRLIVYLIVSFGLFMAWQITGLFISKTIHRLLLTFGWYFSPILVFYTPNFLADPVALSMSMAAWYFYLKRWFGIEPHKNRILYTICVCLAGLIKVSYLITHIAVILISLLWNRMNRDKQISFQPLRHEILWLFIPFLPVAAWYTYSAQLTAKTWNTHFLQTINPSSSLKEFIENTRYALNTWQSQLYSPNFIYGLIIVAVYALIFQRKKAPLPAFISALLLTGFAAVFVLFNVQFRYHDYYFILLMPALFFMWIFLQQLWLEKQNFIIGLFPLAFVFCFWYMPFRNLWHAKEVIKNRYTPGNEWNQSAFKTANELIDASGAINKIIPDKSRICVAFDPTPNTALYLLKKRGIRISEDFDPNMTAGILSASKADYLILNDTSRWFQKYQPIIQQKIIPLYNNGENIFVYRIDRSFTAPAHRP
jgi:hypothetical protein